MSRLVDPLDLTLVLPMRVDRMDDLGAALHKSSWTRIDPLTRGAPEAESGYVYAELAYFHPHVREFLYGREYPDPTGPVQIYRHTKLHPGNLLVQQEQWSTQFTVRDVYFHHVRPDSLVLSVHLSATEPLSWPHALDAISFIRTISFQHYAAIPKKDDKTGDERFVWDGADAAFLDHLKLTAGHERKPVHDRADELQASIRTRAPNPLAVWDDLLAPLRAKGLSLKLLGDHRMAMMVFAGVPDAEHITDDEWFALSQADSAGYVTYAPAFRNRELRKSAYDRWWDRSAGPDKHKHRYLAGPMTFLCVMNWPPEPRKPYYEQIRTRWRRQHFQIFLLAHYQRAALLILEQRIAALAARIESSAKGGIARPLASEIEELQGDIAKFSSGHWFPEISPQIQGQELYQLLRTHLSLDSLHESVVEDKSLLGNWVQADEANRRELEWDSINRKYLPAVLLVAALGGSVITDPLKKLISSQLSQFVFWSSLSDDVQSLIAGILVFFSLLLIIWPAWRLFRPSGTNK